MRVVESPAPFVHPLYVALDEFDVEDYTNADAYRTEQAPDRANVVIVDGWAYTRDHDVPLDLLWRKGAES